MDHSECVIRGPSALRLRGAREQGQRRGAQGSPSSWGRDAPLVCQPPAPQVQTWVFPPFPRAAPPSGGRHILPFPHSSLTSGPEGRVRLSPSTTRGSACASAPGLRRPGLGGRLLPRRLLLGSSGRRPLNSNRQSLHSQQGAFQRRGVPEQAALGAQGHSRPLSLRSVTRSGTWGLRGQHPLGTWVLSARFASPTGGGVGVSSVCERVVTPQLIVTAGVSLG